MEENGINQKDWASKYHYREAGAVDSCDLCSYAIRIDTDHDKRVEALTCSAGSEDTGGAFPVDFGSICDLFLPEMMEEGDDDEEIVD
ncbi:MAG: hypothetical protein M1455_10315 [Actinobacteria bacterium]|nr:hypothetical protein [Actinomycetota bacterium]